MSYIDNLNFSILSYTEIVETLKYLIPKALDFSQSVVVVFKEGAFYSDSVYRSHVELDSFISEHILRLQAIVDIYPRDSLGTKLANLEIVDDDYEFVSLTPEESGLGRSLFPGT